REVDLLLDAGHRLRDAHVGVAGGADAEAFARARSTENDALRRLMRAAEALLAERGRGSGSVVNDVAGSLRAAAISTTGRELLARGRFTQPLTVEGFEVVSELAGNIPEPAARADPRQR